MRLATDPVRTYSVRQVARLSGFSTSALYEAIATGRAPWPVIRLDRGIRIPRDAVDAWLNNAEPTSGEVAS